MTSIRDHLALHATALQLRETRNGVLMSNLANAATPGFQARDFDFQTTLAARVGAGGALAISDARHIATGGATPGQLGYRVPVTPALDGNTVEAGVEQMEFAENTLRYQTSLMFLNRRISGLMRAMRGE
ncbi:flagellar basal body rod protein FlgB [Roseicyclus mahoneyensis]|uniref:Flagellar basal body rod protein FlgB n=1 Tax=Roseicyclus mahoneyensis TaxID=164332 RepID=A0A316GJJ0_9RHOB|nr:flagellar basal body rod protein FlgB [Roseicyclus mahoneyensis]PWK60427.1 flagellar basal-body rod protein FlgB [Roseicyclus mahoneyensis]